MKKFAAIVSLLSCAAMASAVPAAADESPRIIAGTLVPVSTQQDLGLVTVRGVGSCSGTLLNRYWVLTASHCVSSNGAIDGPDQPLSGISISATWVAGDAAQAKQLVRYHATGHDVALIYLGANNLGPVRAHPVSATAMTAGTNFTAYGQGIFGYATTPPDTPARYDGQYRTAAFQASSADTDGYSFPPNAQSQIIAGGDSGGPDVLATGAIAGVHSTCVASSCLAGHTCGPGDPWSWVTGISICTSARVDPIATDIQNRIRRTPCTGHVPACTEAVYAKLLLLR